VSGRFAAAVATFALAFPAGALAAHVLLEGAPRRIATDLAQPLPVVTAWGTYGGWCFATLGGAVALATLALVVLLLAAPARRPLHEHPAALVLALAVAGLAGAAAFPFTFSSDPYAYAAYGAMAERGIDPYVPVAAGVHGAAIDAARRQWGGAYPVCVYGPAFVAFARLVRRATEPFGPAAALAAFRALAGLAFLASIAFLDRALAGLEAGRRFAILAAYGLDPVLLWSAAEGHNDAFVLAIAAAAALAVRRGWGACGGLVLGFSAAFKAPGALLAAGLALDAAFVARRPGIAVAAAAGIALAAAVAIPAMLPAFAAVGGHGQYAPQVSLPDLVGPLAASAIALVTAGFALVRLRARDRGGFAWLGLAAAAVLPNLYPWYALWLVPFALAAGRTGAGFALYGVTICALLRYLPDATGNMTPSAVRIVTVVALSPLAALVISRFASKISRSQKAVVPS
jgi:hypothetical protein